MPSRDFPEEWSKQTLRTTAESGRFCDGDWIESPYITEEGIRLVQTGNIGVGRFIEKPDSRKFITQQSFDELGCTWVYPEDILISRLADPIGRACRVPDRIGPCVTAVDCTIYRPDPETIDPEFALQLLNWRQQLGRLEVLAGGSTRQRISRSNLGDIAIVLPSLPEQRRIAEILDAADEAIRQTERVIAKLREVKRGLLHDLLTRGLDADGNLRDPVTHPEQFEDSALGSVPREWGVSTIGACLEFITDYRGKTPPYSEEGVPAISAENIGDGRVKSITKYVTPEVYRSWLTRGRPFPGDVIFTTEAPVGEVALVPGDRTYLLTRRLMALRPDTNSLRKHFLYWILFQMKKLKAWDPFILDFGQILRSASASSFTLRLA